MSQCIRGSKVIVLRTFHLAFQKPQQSGAGERKNKVHYHGNGKGFKISIICTCNPFCCVEKLYNSNNGKDAGIFDVDDQVVADLGHNVAQSLRKNYAHHSLHMSHSNGFRSLCLPLINREDSTADCFCHIGSRVNGNYKKCGKPHGHINVKQISTSIINEHGLYHHRGAAEKFHITGHNKFEKSNQCLFNVRISFVHRNCLNNSNYKANKAP